MGDSTSQLSTIPRAWLLCAGMRSRGLSLIALTCSPAKTADGHSLCSQAFGNLGTGILRKSSCSSGRSPLRDFIKRLKLNQSSKASGEGFEDNCHSMENIGEHCFDNSCICSGSLGTKRLAKAASLALDVLEQISKICRPASQINFKFERHRRKISMHYC